MAWLRGKVALGSFPDLAGAVNKISESVKNIEKNFDNALGFEDQTGGTSSSTVNASHSWSPELMAFGNSTAEFSPKFQSSKRPESSGKHHGFSKKCVDITEKDESLRHSKVVDEADGMTNSTEEKGSVETSIPEDHQEHSVERNYEIHVEVDGSAEKHMDTNSVVGDQTVGIVGYPEEAENIDEKPVENNIAISDEVTAIITDDCIEVEADLQTKPSADDAANVTEHGENSKVGSTKDFVAMEDELGGFVDQVATNSPVLASYDGQDAIESKPHGLQSHPPEDDDSEMVPDVVAEDEDEIDKAHIVNQFAGDEQRDEEEPNMSSGRNLPDNAESAVELKRLKMELKKMETALLGAARQAQAKADEIEKLMIENEQLKSITVDQKRKSNADIESLQEEYHQRVSALERKVYALMRERDTLRREQNKRSDATTLLKEKDDIITQVMAEGEELSKKQAVQESTIRKLWAQIREFEEEKKRFISKLKIEENKLESLRKDKEATDKLLQETIDKNKAELAAQKEHLMNELNAAKEEKLLAEARANNEVRTELESCLRETEEREAMLVQTLKELRQTLSRKELQAASREDMLRKDIDDLQKRYQASERRCEELVTQVPESTRPLLRQIEAMRDATARKTEAWAAVEGSLNMRLQDAEDKAAAAEERDRSVSAHLSQTLSRVNVLEAQISCLRAEKTQLTRSLEKERQRASESRQDYLALKEEADTHKCHVNQVKEEMKELKRKHKLEMQEALTQHKFLQQDIEREKVARMELEKTTRLQVSTVHGQSSAAKTKSVSANGLTRRVSSARSLSSIEESFFPQLSMETIRDSLSEELVKMTKEREKLRREAALLPSIKAELEALRFRHSAALELMGERDEELEELRADIVDLKEMYREQVDMLVNKIQNGSSINVSQGGY